MKQMVLIFIVLMTSIASLHANITNYTCPPPTKIVATQYSRLKKANDKDVSYAWSSPTIPPGSWSGGGGKEVGNWQKANIVFPDEQHTEMICTYQNGTIRMIVDYVCTFESGTLECTGSNCTIGCLPFSETSKVSGTCTGYNIGGKGSYSCFGSFSDRSIVDPWKIHTNPPKSCGDEGYTANIYLTVKNSPVCVNIPSFSLTDTIPITPPQRPFLINLPAEWCGEVHIIFSPSTNGVCP